MTIYNDSIPAQAYLPYDSSPASDRHHRRILVYTRVYTDRV